MHSPQNINSFTILHVNVDFVSLECYLYLVQLFLFSFNPV